MTTATTDAATDAAMDAAVVFTEQAARKVSELMENEERDDLKLRVFVTGGGCSGFQYGFSFEDEQAEDWYCTAMTRGLPRGASPSIS